MTEPRWKRTCGARNVETGRSCALLAGHDGAHIHGRTEFYLTVGPGEACRREELFRAAATARQTGEVW